MRIKEFSVSLKKLFYNVSIDMNNMELHGTYQYSYWASDIDLYEPVKYKDLKNVIKTIVALSKIYMIKEVKVVENNRKHRYYDDFKKIKTSKPELIKVDLVLFDLVFPIDVSIIYDFDNGEQPMDDLISDMLDDVIDDNTHLYKKLKRLNNISNLIGVGDLFEEIIDNTELGVLYLSKVRLQLLEEIENDIGRNDFYKYLDSVHEDLRKFGYKPSDNLDKIMDDKIKKLLKF